MLSHGQLRSIQLFYCDHYEFPLPPSHKFPVRKYRLVREELEADARFTFCPASRAARETLLRVHEDIYVNQFVDGTLDNAALRRIGFPWSPELVNRTLASVGGTLLAADAALTSGVGGTLAGGTHHAYRAEGSGFCVFNDLAVAVAWMRAEKWVDRVAIVDLDVHQGDGTAAIFAGEPSVFTLSLHGARNFPFRKQASVLDVALPDGTHDEAYLAALKPALEEVWNWRPDVVLFQSGVDALAGDRLGRLALTFEGLRQRDKLVIEGARDLRVPLLITLGGGYSDPIELTVRAHAQTFRIAADVYVRSSSSTS